MVVVVQMGVVLFHLGEFLSERRHFILLCQHLLLDFGEAAADLLGEVVHKLEKLC